MPTTHASSRAAGDIVTCTLTNTWRGHIIVDKVTEPAGELSSFSLATTRAAYTGFDNA